jgi:hypothetical protein
MDCVAPFDPIWRAADRIRLARDRFGSMRGPFWPDFGVKLMPADRVGKGRSWQLRPRWGARRRVAIVVQ